MNFDQWCSLRVLTRGLLQKCSECEERRCCWKHGGALKVHVGHCGKLKTLIREILKSWEVKDIVWKSITNSVVIKVF